MRTEIIILAQGVQSRLPGLELPKQWLALPACANTPILHRTIVQLWDLCGEVDSRVTVVTWPKLAYLITHNRIHVRMNDTIGCYEPVVGELRDPGNSSLKGAHASLDGVRRWDGHRDGRRVPVADRTVILLGDVVYSWKCLELLLLDTSHREVTVCGTSDLSPGGGELWGISWHRDHEPAVQKALDRALEKHPPFTDYQPGQLRRWYWAMCDQTAGVGPFYRTVDDYTDDVDVLDDIMNLPAVAVAAAADDLTRGITWPIS